MVIVDSSVWVEFLAGRSIPETVWLRKALPRGEIGLTTLIYCEVLQGIADAREYRKTRDYLGVLPIFEVPRTAVALMSAENYRVLRAQATTVRSTIDCITATFCLQAGHILLHRDRDFEPFRLHLGLKTVKV